MRRHPENLVKVLYIFIPLLLRTVVLEIGLDATERCRTDAYDVVEDTRLCQKLNSCLIP
jgi:hypothetical protein